MDKRDHVPSQPASTIHAGFIPLLDCAPLVMAKELGFDRLNGITLQLHRETSWANIRDKVELGVFDCAHMLAPMPLAATLGLGRPINPLIAPLVLSLNGNAITVSNALYDAMMAEDAEATRAGGMRSARALERVVRRRQAEGRELITLGMVYPFSAHNYDLRCWLSSVGLHPDTDVNLVVVPPPLLSASLNAGKVDGFCVGSPWNSVSVSAGDGVIIALKDDLWPASPEKVLCVKERWADESQDRMHALVSALLMACRWLGEPSNHAKAAGILAQPQYVGVDAVMLEDLLDGHVEAGRGHVRENKGMVLFTGDDANRPRQEHAIWFLTQMIRWGQARLPFSIRDVAARVYRDDVFSESLRMVQSGMRGPRAEKTRFFEGEAFDPVEPLLYLDRVRIKSEAIDLTSFHRMNP